MNEPDDDELAASKYALIAPCIEQGMSIKQRALETGVHRTTLGRLVDRFNEGGFVGLIRKRRSDKGTFEVDDPLTEIIRAHLIALPHQSRSTIQRMIARICSKQGWTTPTYWTINRIFQMLPRDLLTLSKDSAEYKRLYELIHRFEASCANEIWQADHNFMDIFVWDDLGQAMKPVITVILDDYSRAVTGYYLDFTPPSAQRTALALRQAIWYKDEPKWLACGIPEKLYTDRGADFVSNRLHKISVELKFELIKGRPYHPQGKGKIERFFETMNQLFLCELPGYTPEGSSPNPPGLTLSQLRKTFHDWLINEYMQRENEDTKQTPLDKWRRHVQVPRMPESLDQLHLLLMSIPDRRLVRKDGIYILTYCYFNTELQHGYMRESVVVRYDPSDISQIFVFHENKFVCIATCAELAGTRPTYQDVRKARSSRVRYLRSKITAANRVVKSYANQSARTISDQVQEIVEKVSTKSLVQIIRRYSVDE
ncbi:MAG: DDE-type integrase/transposase/recombinase [Candidatus Obscuribacterales bacterium]|nr:DDE-type integrase/transposase/recombinase [Candidatus Obscuribacterales bacterium]